MGIMPEEDKKNIYIKGSDYLIKNSDEYIKNGGLISVRGEIAEIGETSDLEEMKEDYDIERVIDGSGKIISPGFIQIHVHLLQTLFRGTADDLELLEWLNEKILPMEANISRNGIYYSSKLSLLELLKSGVTSILDFGSVKHQEKIFEAMVESGIRGGSGKIIIDREGETPDSLVESTQRSINESLELMKEWDGTDNRISYFFTPRFVPTCTEESLKKSAELSREHDVGLHSHASENRGEVELVRDLTGKENVEYLNDIGFLGDNTVLAHCIWINEEEKDMLSDTGTTVAHCPSANLKLASGIAETPEMLDKGVNVSIGSDGAPCNNNLDIFEDMRRASLIQKGRLLNPVKMKAQKIFDMVTLNGAEALGIEEKVGSLEEGKRADFTLIETDNSHVSPFTDYQSPISTIVYASKSTDVSHTIVDGRILFDDYSFTTLNKDRILEEAEKEALKLYDKTLRN